MSTKYGFTLAEVLITLGVIGVVAAMTLPALINNYQKYNTAVQLKKVYATFSQALASSQYDNESSKNWTTTEPGSSYEDNLAYFNKYWKPYLKLIKVCKTFRECGYKTTGYATYLDKNSFYHYGQFNNVPGFILGDGTYAYIRPYNSNSTEDSPQKLQLLSIDLNGPRKPNQIGRDVFQFEINISKGIISGFGNPKNCKLPSPSTEDIRSCGGKVMVDGWEIRDDYPW